MVVIVAPLRARRPGQLHSLHTWPSAGLAPRPRPPALEQESPNLLRMESPPRRRSPPFTAAVQLAAARYVRHRSRKCPLQQRQQEVEDE